MKCSLILLIKGILALFFFKMYTTFLSLVQFNMRVIKRPTSHNFYQIFFKFGFMNQTVWKISQNNCLVNFKMQLILIILNFIYCDL